MKIAVLCLPGIGDSLMATPLIKSLRKNYPNAIIDIICMFDGVAYCFKNNPDIDHIYRLSLYNVPLRKGLWEILLMRKKNSYDISLLAFPAYRREYHIVQFLLGAKKRISHVFWKGFWKECNFFDTDRVEVDEKVHNVVNNLNLLHALGIRWEKDKRLKLFYNLTLDKKDKEFGENYIKSLNWGKNSVIGIHPGSMNSLAGIRKRWPFKNFAKVATQLANKGKKCLIFIGPSEGDIDKKILETLGDKKNCVIVTGTSFGQSLGILSQIKLLVTNDNGFAHLANALHIKEIVLFGPTNPLWCAPIEKKFVFSLRKATFTPWFRNDMKVTHPPKAMQSGMNKISVKDVIQAVNTILKN